MSHAGDNLTSVAETQAFLERCPPVPLAPPTTDPFTIVVLSPVSASDSRQREAIRRTLHRQNDQEETLPGQPVPFVLTTGLSYGDAMLVQFELISCDIISAVVPQNIVSEAPAAYLHDLYRRVRRSTEFAEAFVCIKCVPDDHRGSDFLNQFLGRETVLFPYHLIATQKKARIMQQWASRIGGIVEVRL